MDTPEETFSLRQMAPPRRRTGLTIGLVVGGLVLAAATAAGVTYAVTRQSSTSTPASPSTPVANGIARPDESCVTTDGTDHQDRWNGNGW